MTSLTINNLDDQLIRRLGESASNNGRSIEHEARVILRDALKKTQSSENIVDVIREVFGPDGGIDIELPPRVREYW